MAEPHALETGIYLLTPTHAGTGQAAGAVDLPIARETHTHHPLLPASALKGVLRDLFEKVDDKETIKTLFGPPPPGAEGDSQRALFPGELVLTDALLLAFPVRSLNAPFYWITCPLVLERWQRLRRAFELPPLAQGRSLPPEGTTALSFAHRGPLVLEDFALTPDRPSDPTLKAICDDLAGLLPETDDTARRLPDHLICLPSGVFAHLVTRCTPVQARIQLTDGKTTDSWTAEDGTKQSGNLWYEETLPPDCLFTALIGWRKGDHRAILRTRLADQPTVQIGGNETIGQGRCHWRAAPDSAPASHSGAKR